MLVDHGLHDVVDGRNVARALLSRAQVVDELLGGQPFRFGKGRSKDRRDDHFVGRAERSGEVILEHAPARRGGARLEDRPDAAIRVTCPQRRQCFVYRRRMVREIVQHRHARRAAHHLEPPLDPLEYAEAVGKIARRYPDVAAFTDGRTELIVFFTPKVIYDMNNINEASDELKSRVRKLSRYMKDEF